MSEDNEQYQISQTEASRISSIHDDIDDDIDNDFHFNSYDNLKISRPRFKSPKSDAYTDTNKSSSANTESMLNGDNESNHDSSSILTDTKPNLQINTDSSTVTTDDKQYTDSQVDANLSSNKTFPFQKQHSFEEPFQSSTPLKKNPSPLPSTDNDPDFNDNEDYDTSRDGILFGDDIDGRSPLLSQDKGSLSATENHNESDAYEDESRQQQQQLQQQENSNVSENKDINKSNEDNENNSVNSQNSNSHQYFLQRASSFQSLGSFESGIDEYDRFTPIQEHENENVDIQQSMNEEEEYSNGSFQDATKNILQRVKTKNFFDADIGSEQDPNITTRGLKEEIEAIEALKQENYRLKVRIVCMETMVSENSDSGVAELKKKLADSQAARIALKIENEKLRKNLKNLKNIQDEDSINAKAMLNSDIILELEEQLTSYKSQLYQAREDVEILSSNLFTSNQTVKAYQKECEELQQHVEELSFSNEELMARLEYMERMSSLSQNSGMGKVQGDSQSRSRMDTNSYIPSKVLEQVTNIRRNLAIPLSYNSRDFPYESPDPNMDADDGNYYPIILNQIQAASKDIAERYQKSVAKNDILSSRVNDLEIELDNANVYIQDLEAEIDEKNAQIEQLTRDQIQEIDEMTDILKSNTEQYEDLKQRYQLLEEDFTTLSGDFEFQTETLEDLGDQLNQKEKELEETTQLLNLSKEKLKASATEIHTLQETVQKLKSNESRQNVEHAIKLESEIRELLSDYNDKQELSENILDDIKMILQQNNEIPIISSKLEESVKQNSDLYQLLEKSQEDLSQVLEKKKQLETELEDLKNQLEDLENEEQIIRQENEVLHLDLQSNQSHIEKLEGQLKNLNINGEDPSKEQMRQEIEELCQKLGHNQEEIVRCLRELAKEMGNVSDDEWKKTLAATFKDIQSDRTLSHTEILDKSLAVIIDGIRDLGRRKEKYKEAYVKVKEANKQQQDTLSAEKKKNGLTMETLKNMNNQALEKFGETIAFKIWSYRYKEMKMRFEKEREARKLEYENYIQMLKNIQENNKKSN